MWNYEKRLQYPVRITQTNPRLAQVIISQFGGPDGELGASMRYLSQRYTMPYKEVTGILTDIGTEELAHLEIVCAIVHQLTRNLSPEEIEHSGFAPYYVDHIIGSKSGMFDLRICSLLCGSHSCSLATVCRRCPLECNNISVKRGSDHRSP